MADQRLSADVASVPTSLAEIIDAMPVGIVVVDASGRIEFANAALERMFGYSRNELKDAPVEQLMPLPFRHGHQALLAGYVAAPVPRAMGVGRDLYGLSRDDRQFPVEIGLSPLRTPSGFKTIATVSDISERRRRENFFSQLFDNALYGMLLVDGSGRILMANKEVERLFGYPLLELIGQGMEILVPERHRARHPGHRAIYAAEPTARNMGANRDLTGRHRDGTEIPVEIGLAPIETDEGGATLAVISDISARKNWEMKLKQANADLDEFTYVASHDLKSPLRGIADLLDWIGEGAAAGDVAAVQKNLERARLRIGRMEQIIEDLLRYARSGEASTANSWLDLPEIIGGVVEVLAVPPEFQIIVSCDVPSMMAARTPLETVLRNLVSNAIKHHDRGGGRIEISVAADDAYCVFTVADDGPGIPPPARERIFRLFQTLTAKEREGSGIGLAVVKRLVEAHGGRITVDSTDGEGGARFRFWWPRFARKMGETANDRA